MSLSKKIFFNTIAATINILGGLLRNKIFAAYLSINLFGILSIGQQAMSLLYTFFALGLPLGFTAYAAELVTKGKSEQIEAISKIIVLVSSLAAGFFILVCIILWVDPFYVSNMVAGRFEYALPIALIILSAPLMVVETCLFSVMEGMGNLKGIVAFKIIPTLIGLPLLFYLVSTYSLLGASIGMILTEVILIISAVYLLRDYIDISRYSGKVATVFKSVVKVAALSFMAGIGWMVTDFIVKRYLLGLLGETSNAVVQSVAKVTDLYPSVALSWLTMHIFPTVSMSKENKSALSESIGRTVMAAISIIVPIVIVLFVSREFVLKILYTSEFTIAYGYFGAMLVIGIPKVYSWILGVSLLPLGRKREWFYSVLIQIIVYAGCIYWGINNNMILYAIPFAHGISLCAQIIYTMVVLWKHEVRFGNAFVLSSLTVFGMNMLIVLSLFFPWLILLVTAMFIFYLFKFGLFREAITKANEILRNRFR